MNTLSLFFNVKDKEAVDAIVQDIVREKLKQPEQIERMITIEKEQVEGFRMYCSDHDIPVNFMESQNGVKCIFNSAYEKQMAAVVENFKKLHSELSKTSIEVTADARSRPKIVISDEEQGKQLTMNFCTKAKLERVLQERMGFGNVKAVEATNALTSKAVSHRGQFRVRDVGKDKYFFRAFYLHDARKQIQGQLLLQRETACTGSVLVRLDLNDKDTAKRQLMNSFGITEKKAEKIIAKAQKQTVAANLLNKAKKKASDAVDTIKNKKIDRGSRH